jgi:hypothetical protein
VTKPGGSPRTPTEPATTPQAWLRRFRRTTKVREDTEPATSPQPATVPPLTEPAPPPKTSNSSVLGPPSWFEERTKERWKAERAASIERVTTGNAEEIEKAAVQPEKLADLHNFRTRMRVVGGGAGVIVGVILCLFLQPALTPNVSPAESWMYLALLISFEVLCYFFYADEMPNLTIREEMI